jgi:hypothetical protein
MPLAGSLRVRGRVVFHYAVHDLTAVIGSMRAPEANGNLTGHTAAHNIHVFDGASGRNGRC